MLTIVIPASERWDEKREIFVTTEELVLELEHSLVSISEWEAKYKKPFLGEEEKTSDQMFDYIYMMRLDRSIKQEQLYNLTPENVRTVQAYIEDKQTATTFSKEQMGKPTREIITSELIYCWMCQQQIPWEAQTWHLSRLLTLINVVSIKNQPPKKTNPIDTMKNHAALNRARRSGKPHIPKH